MQQSYTPSEATLEKYAELIVGFGLRNRNGSKPKKGSVVQFIVPEAAKPLYFHLQRAILNKGYHPLGTFKPSSDDTYNLEKDFYDQATKAQLDFCPLEQQKGLIEQIDCTIHVLAETCPHALNNVDSDKVLQRSQSQKKAIGLKRKKINEGKLNWTIVLYGTDAGAKEAGLSLRQYWNQIIKACYLDKTDPIKHWEEINATVQETAKKLTDMKIKSLHIVGEDIDLTLGIGKNRKWAAGGGNNIPSYEVFTSPTWQEVDGWAKLNQPHYRYGKKIEGIQLWFEKGIVVKSEATKNHDLLKSMLNVPGGNKLGEVSLTDARLSRIDKFMAEILYDENTGGKFGNTHIALGAAFRECYKGKTDPAWKNADWDKLGYNNSVVHSDIISTTDRTATVTFYDGTTKVIYKKGQFTI
jgi:aminopeptidase